MRSRGGGNQNIKKLRVVKRLQEKLPDYGQDMKISKFYQFLHMFNWLNVFFSKPEPLGPELLANIMRELVLCEKMGGNLPGGRGVHHTINDDMGHMDTLKRKPTFSTRKISNSLIFKTSHFDV
jgi:hypothetical protein